MSRDEGIQRAQREGRAVLAYHGAHRELGKQRISVVAYGTVRYGTVRTIRELQIILFSNF
jgi:hypothetical protein